MDEKEDILPGEDGLDLSGNFTLDRDIVPEKWYVYTGRAIGRSLAKLLVAVAGLLCDVVKGLITVVAGIFYGIYLIFKYIALGIRGAYRYFRDVDWAGRLSFLVMGFSHLKNKLYADGIIFLAVEILYIVWLAVTGIADFQNLAITENAYEGNQIYLINGIFAVIITLLFAMVYYFHLRSMHDGYMIRHEPEFKSARKAQLKVLDNNARYEDIVNARNAREVKKIAFENYGFTLLQSRYISYVPWDRLCHEYRGISGFFRKIGKSYHSTMEGLYAKYDAWRRKVRMAGNGEIFARFLEWELLPKKENRGYQAVRAEIAREHLRFQHTYDKYNDYHAVVRDAKARLAVYADIDELIKVYEAKDRLSEKSRNSTRPIGPQATEIIIFRNPGLLTDAMFGKDQISRDRGIVVFGKIKAKDAGFRISQAFAVSEEASVRAARMFLKLDKEAKKTGVDLDGLLARQLETLEQGEKDWLAEQEKKGYTNPKLIASRIVGIFETDYKIALSIAKDVLLADKTTKLEKKANAGDLRIVKGKVNYPALAGNSLKEILGVQREVHQTALDAFVKADRDRAESAAAVNAIYKNADRYDGIIDNEKLFILTVQSDYLISKRDATIAYRNLKAAKKAGSGDVALKLGETSEVLAMDSQTPFHGQPTVFKRKARQYLDERFAVTIMSLPLLGILVFSVVPLIFSILIAFTDWNRTHADRMFHWDLSAWGDFLDLGSSSAFMSTFWELLLWTIVWAILATFLNYIFGIILALMINRKSIKLKKMWRTVFVISIAIPQFITLLTINRLFSSSGPVNEWLMTQSWYTEGVAPALGFGLTNPSTGRFVAQPFPFLGDGTQLGDITDAVGNIVIRAFWPKLFIVIINMWVGIPYTMLSTSGILMNIPDDLYESSQIDGANKWRQFWSITMPYVLFVTGPSLLTSFVGNINNFNVIFFLNGGGTAGINGLHDKAGPNSLLITWIYNLSTGNNPDYNVASILGCFIFLLCGFFSLIAYSKLGSVKNEEDFQ